MVDSEQSKQPGNAEHRKEEKMKRQMALSLMVMLPCVASGAASAPAPATVSDIRKVDFLNFTYPSSLCAQEYGGEGIGKAVPVKNGEFKSKNAYFAVAGDRILYADVTGDGLEDAIVPADCGGNTANFSRSEIYVYTVQNGRAKLLAEISDKDLERDYRRHYPDAESYWGLDADGLKVKGGKLELNVLMDGPHAAPKYISTLVYGWSSGALRLVGKPERRSAAQ